jgi:hypothetical protein
MASSSQAAPWRALFLEHVSTMPSPEFTLATIHPGAGGAPATPRARTCVFRGMLASLPVNPKNTASLNPPTRESDLATFTTDVRMHKVPDLFGTATATSGSLGAGGGAHVEAVWWPRETGTQWRLRGAAWLLSDDLDRHEGAAREGESADEADAGARGVREHLLKQMRERSEEETRRAPIPDEQQGQVAEGEWSFAREITAHFGNLSPGMRGTFKNPPPGTPRRPEDGDGSLGQQVTDLEDAAARANFRVVVIVPDEVDQTDLSDPKAPRRYIYRRTDGGAGWEKTEVWP